MDFFSKNKLVLQVSVDKLFGEVQDEIILSARLMIELKLFLLNYSTCSLTFVVLITSTKRDFFIELLMHLWLTDPKTVRCKFIMCKCQMYVTL